MRKKPARVTKATEEQQKLLDEIRKAVEAALNDVNKSGFPWDFVMIIDSGEKLCMVVDNQVKGKAELLVEVYYRSVMAHRANKN